MSLNTNVAEQVRKTAFGRDMRKPIADGCDFGDGAMESMEAFTRSEMREVLEDGKDSMDKTIRKAGYKLDRTVLHSLHELEDIYPKAHERLVPIDEKCDTRVSNMSLNHLQGTEYYRLTFTRANGE